MTPAFSLPTVFRQMYDAGLLNHDSENCLVLSDTEWWTPEQIAGHEPEEDRIPGLVPFAQNGRGDTWSWYTEWCAEGELAVLFCPHDEDKAIGYAPSLAGCIYRLLIEEMSNSWLVDLDFTPEEVSELFARYAVEVASYLPAQWVATLQQLGERPLEETEEGSFAVLSQDEAREIIERDLAFTGLEKEIPQWVEEG